MLVISVQITQIIISVALIVLILLQSKGAGLGSVFGGTGSVFKTRRGIERLLFNFTIAFAAIWAIFSIVSIKV